jgi:hypothetical protein
MDEEVKKLRAAQEKQWLEAMEKLGPEIVHFRFTNRMPVIDNTPYPESAFVQSWLKVKNEEKEAQEESVRWYMRWTYWAALGAAFVGIIAIAVAIFGLLAQIDRWKDEDEHNGPQVHIILDAVRSDGWMHGVLQIDNVLKGELRFISLEAVRPADLKLAPQNNSASDTAQRGPAIVGETKVLRFEKTISAFHRPGDDSTWGTDFFLRTSGAPGEILLKFTMREADYPNKEWTKLAAPKTVQ